MVSDHVSVRYDHFCLVLVNISNLQIVLCNFFKSSFVFHFIVLFDMETPNCFCSSAEGVARDFKKRKKVLPGAICKLVVQLIVLRVCVCVC